MSNVTVRVENHPAAVRIETHAPVLPIAVRASVPPPVVTVVRPANAIPGRDGRDGKDGRDGTDGTGVVAYAAAHPISGHRAARLTEAGLTYASCTQAAHATQFAGVTLGAADAGGEVLVKSIGVVDEPTWSWVPEAPVYIGPDGLLVQQLGAGARFIRIIGIAVTPTRLLITPREPITLLED